jgi:hypothetical protein
MDCACGVSVIIKDGKSKIVESIFNLHEAPLCS